MSGLTVLIVIVGLYLVGAYVEYSTGFPFAVGGGRYSGSPLSSADVMRASRGPDQVPLPQASTAVPIVSNVQGAQDAPRADVPMGESIDLDRCYNTMIARRLVPAEAKSVCRKLIDGISR